eukprot:tig00021312_g20074.t1
MARRILADARVATSTSDELAALAEEIVRLAVAGESFSLVPPSLLRRIFLAPAAATAGAEPASPVECRASLALIATLERYCEERRAMFQDEQADLEALLLPFRRYPFCRAHCALNCLCGGSTSGVQPEGNKKTTIRRLRCSEPRQRRRSLPGLAMPPSVQGLPPWAAAASCPSPIAVFSLDLEDREAQPASADHRPLKEDSALLAAAARLRIAKAATGGGRKGAPERSRSSGAEAEGEGEGEEPQSPRPAPLFFTARSPSASSLPVPIPRKARA